MERERLDSILREVIDEARELKIPVSAYIAGEVRVNPRPKKRYGCCRHVEGKYRIEISEFLLDCDEEKIRSVLAHEVLHTCKGCSNHGPRWKEYADRMNHRHGYQIKRVSSPEEMGIEEMQGPSADSPQKDRIRYIIKCTKCGREYPRQRFTCVMKKLNAYRCQCGGKLILLEIEKQDCCR